jgi:MmyB-like transcription regulator ligand binding domain
MREALARYPADDYLSALGDDLRAVSPSFAELWEQQPVA